MIISKQRSETGNLLSSLSHLSHTSSAARLYPFIVFFLRVHQSDSSELAIANVANVRGRVVMQQMKAACAGRLFNRSEAYSLRLLLHCGRREHESCFNRLLLFASRTDQIGHGSEGRWVLGRNRYYIAAGFPALLLTIKRHFALFPLNVISFPLRGDLFCSNHRPDVS